MLDINKVQHHTNIYSLDKLQVVCVLCVVFFVCMQEFMNFKPFPKTSNLQGKRNTYLTKFKEQATLRENQANPKVERPDDKFQVCIIAVHV